MQVSEETGKVVWYSHLFKNFLQFVVIHTVKGFSIVSEAEVDVCVSVCVCVCVCHNHLLILFLWRTLINTT